MSPNHCHCLDARCRRPLAEGPAEGNGVFSTRKKFLIKGRDVPGNANNMLEPKFKIWFSAFKKPIPSMYGTFRALAFSVRLESS